MGGDFVATASATATVPVTQGFVSWSSVSLTSDMQTFLNNPSTNFGWLVLGDETTTQTIRRFDSSERTVTSFLPTMTVTFHTASSIPEPGSLLLVSTAWAGWGVRRRWRWARD